MKKTLTTKNTQKVKKKVKQMEKHYLHPKELTKPIQKELDQFSDLIYDLVQNQEIRLTQLAIDQLYRFAFDNFAEKIKNYEDDITDQYEDGFEAGKDAAYEDAYDIGYASGYEDGFYDGETKNSH